MTYPARSTALTAFTADLWWQTVYAAVNHLCETQGMTLVKALQTVLIQILPITWTTNGVAFARLEMSVDGNFGPVTLAGLIRALEDLDLPNSERNVVQADWERFVTGGGDTNNANRGRPIALATMAAAIWVAEHRSLPYSAISVPADMSTLQFATDTIDDGGSDGLVTCVPMTDVGSAAPHQDRIPAGSSTPTETPGSPMTNPPAQAAGGGGGGLVAILALVALGALASTGKNL